MAATFGLAGCLSRGLPLPPPYAGRSEAVTCAAPLCPDGGVIYTIEGTAQPGALVVATNISRMRGDGSRYIATAWADSQGASDAGAPGGHFILTFSPQPNTDGTVTVTQIGDIVMMIQLIPQPDGSYIQSDTSREMTVQP